MSAPDPAPTSRRRGRGLAGQVQQFLANVILPLPCGHPTSGVRPPER